MSYLKKVIRLFIFRRKWRKNNRHNNTYAVDVFPISVAKVGRFSYGGLNIFTFGEGYKVKIGDFCSIGPNVLFVLKADHPINYLSTFPFKVKVLGEQYEATSKGDIVLDDDVWIGANATILSGVHIGQGAIVGAGAVVVSDVPPYAIVGGVPAKVIKYRFSEEIINELVKLDYSKIDSSHIKNNIDLLYREVDVELISELKRSI